MQSLQAQKLEPPAVRLLAVSADPPEVSARFREQLSLTFPILSDPQLTLAQSLKVPAFGKHPQALRYPRKAFLQPSVLMWTSDGKLVFEWRMKTRLWNLFGAVKRLSPEDIAAKARAICGSSPTICGSSPT